MRPEEDTTVVRSRKARMHSWTLNLGLIGCLDWVDLSRRYSPGGWEISIKDCRRKVSESYFPKIVSALRKWDYRQFTTARTFIPSTLTARRQKKCFPEQRNNQRNSKNQTPNSVKIGTKTSEGDLKS